MVQMVIMSKMMMGTLSCAQFVSSDVWDALQVLRHYMPLSWNGEDIQWKLKARTVVIGRYVTAKLTQSDIRPFFN